MLHIVNIELVEDYYQGEKIRNTINHIIEADCEEEVRNKLDRHYELKDVECYVIHYFKINYINELIK